MGKAGRARVREEREVEGHGGGIGRGSVGQVRW